MPILRQPKDSALAREFSEKVTALIALGYDETTIMVVLQVVRDLELKRREKENAKAAVRMKRLRQDREREVAPSPPSKKNYYFENGVIRLNEKDFERWRRIYHRLDLAAELQTLAPWAARQQNWFFAVSGALTKRQREVAIRQIEAEARGRYSGANGQTRVIMQGQG
jgi:hypothetical protein